MKLRFILKSFDQSLLKEALKELSFVLSTMNCSSSGCVSLPAQYKRFCVIRSPHIDKDSREHFEVHLYKQFFDLSFDNPENINLLLNTNLPAGIACFFKVIK